MTQNNKHRECNKSWAQSNESWIQSDEQIRNLLFDACEEPPQDAWERIAAKLPATRWRIWARRTSYAIGAIAALLLIALLLWSPQTPASEASNRAEVVEAAEVVTKSSTAIQIVERSAPAQEALAQAAEPQAAQPAEAQAAEAQEALAQAAEAQAAEAQPAQPAEAQPAEAQAAPAPEPSTSAPEPSTSAAEPALPILLAENREQTPRKKGLNLSVNSNVLSNFTGNGNRGKQGFRNQGLFGSSTPTRSKIEEKDEVNYSIPLTFGINIAYNINERWSVGLGVNYTRLSRNFAGTFYEYEDGTLKPGVNYDKIYNIQQFFGIPITGYFHIIRSEQVNLYVHAGMVLEKCLGNTWTAQARQLNYTEAVNGVQISAGAGLGVDFMITPLFSIYLDPDIKYYFSLNQPTSIRTRQPLMLGFELGARFHL